jgi:uncharacterized RmlC-like cupin family protein
MITKPVFRKRINARTVLQMSIPHYRFIALKSTKSTMRGVSVMKKANAYTTSDNRVEGIHNGEGICFGGRIFEKEQLGNRAWQFIDFWRIPPQTSIGNHLHHNGRELYYIVRGTATMITNDNEFAVETGDLILNEPGDSHGFFNSGEEDVYILVTMVLDDSANVLYENLDRV